MTAARENRYSEPEDLFEQLENNRRWPDNLSSTVNVGDCDKITVDKEIQRELFAEETLDTCEFTPAEYKERTRQRISFKNRYTNEPNVFESTSTKFIENEVEPTNCGECLGDGETQCTECNSDGENHCTSCKSSGEVKCDCGTGSIPCPECDGSTYIECKKCGPNGRINCKNCDDGTVDCECTYQGEKGKRTKEVTETRIRGSNEDTIEKKETTICDICNGSTKRDCKKCNGIGHKPCRCCDSGSYTCNNCQNGQVTCPECGGDPISRCEDCLGEGMIPCDSCGGQGTHPCEVCNQTGNLFRAKIGEVEYKSETHEEIMDAEKIQERVGRKGLDKIRNSEGRLQDSKVEQPHDHPTPEQDVVIRTETEIRAVPVQEIEYCYEDSRYTLYEIDSKIHYENNNHPLSEIAKSEQKALGAIFLLGVLILIGLLFYLFLYVP